MGAGWTLHLLPKDARYRPTPMQTVSALDHLVSSLSIKEIDLLDKSGVSSVQEAIELLVAATGSPEREFRTSFACDPGAKAFGWDPNADVPNERFWADSLTVTLTRHPFPYAEWEDESGGCPECGDDLKRQLLDRIDGVEEVAEPLRCSCGASTPMEKLNYSKGVLFACFALTFGGNDGWYREVKDDREAFADASFMPALESRLGTPLIVLAIR